MSTTIALYTMAGVPQHMKPDLQCQDRRAAMNDADLVRVDVCEVILNSDWAS
ncbi:hypothetical protein ACQCLI_08865 [Pseudomonas nitroreducens]|uniref:hypothetical protein n=1 Tax=Pseudomonas TaxID=286 RepID=UPI000306B1E5|nr:hypothetical protein [Pseudomonas nitroreducens]